MYFIYLDESGNPGRDPVQRFFVLAALATEAQYCMPIQQQLTDLKIKYFPAVQPEEIEVKGRSLIHGKDFFEHVRLETREAILNEVFTMLGRHPFRFFATVVDKANPAMQRLGLLPDDVYRYAYKNLMQRVDGFLGSQKSQGLVFIDSMASSIKIITPLMLASEAYKQLLGRRVHLRTLFAPAAYSGAPCERKIDKILLQVKR
jgi:hypothetical protein